MVVAGVLWVLAVLQFQTPPLGTAVVLGGFAALFCVALLLSPASSGGWESFWETICEIATFWR